MSEKFERLRQALKAASTPEAMKRASEAFKAYNEEQKKAGKHSRPVICSLGYNKSYPNAIPLENVAEQLATNKDFYDLMSKVLGGGE